MDATQRAGSEHSSDPALCFWDHVQWRLSTWRNRGESVATLGIFAGRVDHAETGDKLGSDTAYARTFNAIFRSQICEHGALSQFNSAFGFAFLS
jgi:hypothetical protein